MRPAFDGDDRATLLRRITDETPTLLSRIDHSIPRPLETIVAKAMEKDREDRYTSAEQLAQDLRAFTENRPITARPTTVVQRTGRFVRRHATMVAAAFIVLLIGVIGLSISAAMLKAANLRTERERNNAEGNLMLAADAVDRLLVEMGSIAKSQGELIQAGQFLDASQEFYDQLIAKSEEPTVLTRAVTAYGHLAGLKHALGEHESAIEQYQLVVNLINRLERCDSISTTEIDTMRANTLHGIATAYRSLADVDSQEKYLIQASKIWQRLNATEPTNQAFVDGLNRELNGLFGVYVDSNRFEQAERIIKRLFVLMKPQAGETDPNKLNDMAGICCNYATLLVEQDKLDQADGLLRAAVTTQTHLVEQHPNHAQFERDLNLFQWNLTDLLIRRGKYEEAAEASQEMAKQFGESLSAQYDAANFLLRCCEGAAASKYSPVRIAAETVELWRDSARNIFAEAEPTEATSVDELGFFGWHLAMCRDPFLRDPARALQIVEAGLAKAPDRHFLKRVRAIALYQLNDYQAALEILEPLLEVDGIEGVDALFAAMSHARLGHTEKASGWYQQAIEWRRSANQKPSVYDFFSEARDKIYTEARQVLAFEDSDDRDR